MNLIDYEEDYKINVYDVSFRADCKNYIISKFDELSDMVDDFEHIEFSYKENNGSKIITEMSPLLYPFSTIFIHNKALSEWNLKAKDERIQQYLHDSYIKDTRNLYYFYNIIKNDPNFKNIRTRIELDSYISARYKDMAIFKDIFKYLVFKQDASYDYEEISNNGQYGMQIVKDAQQNTDVLQELMLEPYIKQ